MAVTRRGSLWTGSEAADVQPYLREFAAGGYPVDEVVPATCGACSTYGAGFAVELDDDAGVAVRRCLDCGAQVVMLDSGDHLAQADLGPAACPCGHEQFDVAVGFSLVEDGEVRWISIGLRCRSDGRLGVYADWKIDDSPSRHLLAAV